MVFIESAFNFKQMNRLSTKMKKSCSFLITPDGSVEDEVQALMDSLLMRVEASVANVD
jgi:hypothetical protein